MKNFRKKPIEVEAWQLPRVKYMTSLLQCPRFVSEAIADRRITVRPDALGFLFLFINTLEGRMRADPKDWIICGPVGELYPVKPKIFKLTYEAI